MENVTYHEFYLDSSDASKAVSSTIDALNWPLFNLPFQLQSIKSFKVLEVQIPNSYCVSAGASITITYFSSFLPGDTPTTTTKTYFLLATGTPSGAQIAADLTNQFLADTGYPGSGVSGWGSNYLVCTFVPGSSTPNGMSYFNFVANAASIGPVGNSNQDFQISITDQRSEDVMGLKVGITNCINIGQVGTAAKSLKSLRPSLITGPPYLYVSSNIVGNLCETYLPQGAALLSGGVSSPQMAKIPVNADVGRFIQWSDANTSHWYKVGDLNSLSQIDLFCQLGNYGGYLDFQGLPFSIKLGVLVESTSYVTSKQNSSFRTITGR
jgi:hypothetical protein